MAPDPYRRHAKRVKRVIRDRFLEPHSKHSSNALFTSTYVVYDCSPTATVLVPPVVGAHLLASTTAICGVQLVLKHEP
jgi:hypothetical protein